MKLQKINEAINAEFLKNDEKETKAGVIEPVKTEEKSVEPVNDEVHVAALDGLKTHAEEAKKVVADSTITKNAEELVKEQEDLHETINVKSRVELAALIAEARKNKQTYTISRCLEEGYRYTFQITGVEKLTEDVESVDDTTVLDLTDDSTTDTTDIASTDEVTSDAEIAVEDPLTIIVRDHFDVKPEMNDEGKVTKVMFAEKGHIGDEDATVITFDVTEDEAVTLTKFFITEEPATDTVAVDETEVDDATLDNDVETETEVEKDAEEITEDLESTAVKCRIIWDDCTPTMNRRPTTADDIEEDIHVEEVNSEEEILNTLADLAGYDEDDIADLDGETTSEKIKSLLRYFDDPGDGSANILYISVNGKEVDGTWAYDCLADLDLEHCSEEEVKEAIKSEFVDPSDDWEDDYEDEDELEESAPEQIKVKIVYASDDGPEFYKASGSTAAEALIKAAIKAGCFDEDALDPNKCIVNKDSTPEEVIEAINDQAAMVGEGLWSAENLTTHEVYADYTNDLDESKKCNEAKDDKEIIIPEEEVIDISGDADIDPTFDDEFPQVEDVLDVKPAEIVEKDVLSKFDGFEPTEEVKEFWDMVKEADKIDELEFFLDEFDIDDNDKLAEFLAAPDHRDYLLAVLGLGVVDDMPVDEEPAPVDYADLDDNE